MEMNERDCSFNQRTRPKRAYRQAVWPYVLISSLTSTVISLPAVWYFTAAAYATPGLVAIRSGL